MDRDDLAIDVVIGLSNPHRHLLEAACSELHNPFLHYQLGNMATYIAAADLLIGAGRTSIWERCSIGLPGLVFAMANNQIAQSDALARLGAQFLALLSYLILIR